MNPLEEAIVGVSGVMGIAGGLVGAVAAVATGIGRPRTARALAARSHDADTIADAIINGEALAFDTPDEGRPALILGCAEVLGQYLRGNPAGYRDIDAVMSWYDNGLLRLRHLFDTGARHPGTADPLQAAACLLYAADLHGDRLMAAGEQPFLRQAADLTIAIGTMLLNDTALTAMLPGGYQLVRHRILGTRLLDLQLQGVTDPQLAQTCPFCETDGSVYDQTRLGCANCASVGEFTRTVPAVWTGGAPAPARKAPHPTWWHLDRRDRPHTDPVTAGAQA